jgi:hypothetical protein
MILSFNFKTQIPQKKKSTEFPGKGETSTNNMSFFSFKRIDTSLILNSKHKKFQKQIVKEIPWVGCALIN